MSDVEEEPVRGASTWSNTPPPAPAKSSTLLLSEDLKSVIYEFFC